MKQHIYIGGMTDTLELTPEAQAVLERQTAQLEATEAGQGWRPRIDVDALLNEVNES